MVVERTEKKIDRQSQAQRIAMRLKEMRKNDDFNSWMDQIQGDMRGMIERTTSDVFDDLNVTCIGERTLIEMGLKSILASLLSTYWVNVVGNKGMTKPETIEQMNNMLKDVAAAVQTGWDK